MLDRSDGLVVHVEPAGSDPERWRFEPRSDGRWMRLLEVRNGCRWVIADSGLVDRVRLDAPTLARCPACGRRGLPERVAVHDCQP